MHKDQQDPSKQAAVTEHPPSASPCASLGCFLIPDVAFGVPSGVTSSTSRPGTIGATSPTAAPSQDMVRGGCH